MIVWLVSKLHKRGWPPEAAAALFNVAVLVLGAAGILIVLVALW